MIFEDLTSKDFAEIAKTIPAAYSLPDMRKMVARIGDEYKLPKLDAGAAFFIATECKDAYALIANVTERRVKQLNQARKK